MTTPDRPAAAGVFVVRDPAVCAALEQLLALYRTDPADADNGSSRVAALMADAEARAAELTGDPTTNLPEGATIEQLLDCVHLDGQALSKQDLADVRDDRDMLTKRLSHTEAALHRADGELTATSGLLKDALAKITALEADRAAITQERDETLTAAADQRVPLDRARAEITELRAELNTVRTQSPSVKPAPVHASRARDRDAFASLARRMEDQAAGHPKQLVAGTLRVAARGIRDEITRVYGATGKKAS